MSDIELGPSHDLLSSRYVIQLSNGKRLVLFRLPRIPNEAKADHISGDWSYYAMEAECPHAGGPMTAAHIDIEDSSYIASCPWHSYDFSLTTGQSSYGTKACTFPIVVRDGRIVLHVPDATGLRLLTMEPVSESVKFQHGSSTRISPAAAIYLDDDASLCEWCSHILNTSDPEHKIELTTHLFSLFARRTSPMMKIGRGMPRPPDIPPRPVTENVARPGAMPKNGKGGSVKSRITMLHALANIEQWAIDLALDICVRFATFETHPHGDEPPQPLPREFFFDWLKVAHDEAKHFSLLRARLEELGSHFGALPVHHGLWESATRTAHDLRARISVIALVHEARGLDVNPLTIEKFRKAGDEESVDALTIIHHDEITHVTTGHRWLTWICEHEGTDAVDVFRSNVKQHFWGAVKGPFNTDARLQAGMDTRYYENLGGREWNGDIIAGG